MIEQTTAPLSWGLVRCRKAQVAYHRIDSGTVLDLTRADEQAALETRDAYCKADRP